MSDRIAPLAEVLPTTTEIGGQLHERRSPRPKVAVFAPHPLLTVTLEREGSERQRIHFHAGGQGAWVSRMVAQLGATPILCGLIGGESGGLLRGLQAQAIDPGELRLVNSSAASGAMSQIAARAHVSWWR